MQAKQYYTHLGLTYHSQQSGKNGIEHLFQCPWCNGKSFSVNDVTGAWQCFAGCGKGYPYQFAKKLNPSMPPRDIFLLLEQFDVQKSNPDAAKAKAEPKKPTTPRLDQKDCQQLTRAELDSFCEIKGLDPVSFWALRPFRHRIKPWVLIPCYDPAASANPCGYIRAGIDGKPIEIRYQEDGVWKSRTEKYPVISGSNVGLVGLKSLLAKRYDALVFAEGWKDLVAATYFGYAGVACAMGAGKWRDSWGQVFKAKHVIVVGDVDAAGVGGPVKNKQTGKITIKKGGAEKQTEKIHEYAKSVKNVVLPLTYREKGGLDLYDYLNGVRE